MARGIPTVVVFVLISFFLIFIFLSFKQDLATIFSLIAILCFMVYILNYLGIHPFKRGGNYNNLENTVNRKKTLTILLIGYPVFIIFSFLLAQLVTMFNIYPLQSLLSLNSIFDTLAQSQLIFEGNIWLSIIVFSVLVGTIETLMLASALEFVVDATNTPRTLNIAMISIMLIISIAFVFYHLGAKGVDNIPALVMTGVFGLITMFMIFYERQSLAAVLMHIVNNFIAILLLFGQVSTVLPIVIIFAAFAFGIYLLLKKFNLKFIGG